MNFRTCLLLAVFGSFCCVVFVEGHGYLIDPPNRSSMWRVGYPTPENDNDDHLWCGGLTDQWVNNNGSCGICGDPYEQPDPRENEVGGTYYSGIIVQTYTSGQTVDLSVQLTIQHYGYFEYRLCPYPADVTVEADQACLDEHLLELADGTGTRWYIPNPTPDDALLTVSFNLPAGFTSEHAVLQWHWWTESQKGVCPDGTIQQGCGPQEVFRGCADITIA